jgi:anti-sigma factor RsiW
MPTSDPTATERPHDEAEALLPWYATGQLHGADRARVEAHLARCAHCRRQLMIDRRLSNEFRAMTPELEWGWARLRTRIEPGVKRQHAPRQALAGLMAFARRPAVAAFAAAQLLLVVVAGAMLLSLSEPTYHALGSAPPPADANAVVMFRPSATEAEIRAALGAAGASIVGGPTPANAYLLNLAPPRRQEGLARLRADAAVEMAQPIDGVSP